MDDSKIHKQKCVNGTPARPAVPCFILVYPSSQVLAAYEVRDFKPNVSFGKERQYYTTGSHSSKLKTYRENVCTQDCPRETDKKEA